MLRKGNEMNLREMKMEIEERILASMYEYIEDFEGDTPYTEENVKECGVILEKFVSHLEDVKSDEKTILACIKITVEELNELNKRLNEELIETEQREDLCEFILEVAINAGLKAEEDITEEWREW